MSAEAPGIKIAYAGEIAIVYFNQPQKHNAMTLSMWQETTQAFQEFQQRSDIKVIVMAGAGDRAFVSGADISEFKDKRNNAEKAREYAQISEQARQAMIAIEKPLIAMIQGYCFGAGLDIAMRADIRIASDAAVFSIPAAKLGIAYGVESIQLLTALVGPTHAKDILFTAKRIDSSHAQHIGLVNECVAQEKLYEHTLSYARRIAQLAPLTHRASKAVVNACLQNPDEQKQKQLQALIDSCFASRDYQEGQQAFKEKRTPEFLGK